MPVQTRQSIWLQRLQGSDDNIAIYEYWHQGSNPADIEKNGVAADRVFAMLLCARVFVLKQLVQRLPVNTDAKVARRRWVLAQVLPPRLNLDISPKNPSDDLFTRVLRALRQADTDMMLDIIFSTLHETMTERRDLFPEGTPLFVVIDEAQVAADDLRDYFRSSSGTNLRPILREMYRFFQGLEIFNEIILSGTGFAMGVVKEAVSAISAKPNEESIKPRVFTDIGRLKRDDSSQMDYIRRYLTLSDNLSDRQLLERMVYWFSGRYVYRSSLTLQDSFSSLIL